MQEIDFEKIVSRLGSDTNSFEELVCQLARRTVPNNDRFTRLYGAGGDGGVECYYDDDSENRTGWQAKYVFNIDSLLRQAKKSLDTALKIHANLKKYVLCFPFDLTGPTNRKGMCGQEKADIWKVKQEEYASHTHHGFTVEFWPAYRLRNTIIEQDKNGGLREYFFNQKVLSTEWFKKHLDHARVTAGPRYTPELHVETNLAKWFAAFGRTDIWTKEFRTRLAKCRKVHSYYARALKSKGDGRLDPNWPANLEKESIEVDDRLQKLFWNLKLLQPSEDYDFYNKLMKEIDEIIVVLSDLENSLVHDLEEKERAKGWKGKVDSVGFRQFMAEYMVSFPAGNLDVTRDLLTSLSQLHKWLVSPNCILAFKRTFVLSGFAGAGKTHGACDESFSRFAKGLYSCLAFGHEFRGEPDPWSRFAESLGFPSALGMQGILDLLESAGESTGHPLLIFVDAINETRPFSYWQHRIASMIHSVQQMKYVRICFTCRTSYLSVVLPDINEIKIVEHTGFSGMAHKACQAFFNYYQLDPPLFPVLQQELSNPLYLKLLCETLQRRNLKKMPLGWYGIAPTIKAFLDEKEKQFSTENGTSIESSIVSRSLSAIVNAHVASNEITISISKAHEAIVDTVPQVDNLQVVDWLIRSDLLIVDVPITDEPLCEEGFIRPAFERLGDFLIADQLLKQAKDQTELYNAFQSEGNISKLLTSSITNHSNDGILLALCVIIPEKYHGLEVPDLIEDESLRQHVTLLTLRSIPSRNPDSFTINTSGLLRAALGTEGMAFEALNAILAVACQPSVIDALWFDQLLKRFSLATRDAVLSGFLHDQYQDSGEQNRLINSVYEIPIDQLDSTTAELWATMLLWFTSAADRRIKDKATRAATRLLTSKSEIIPIILDRFMVCDDDMVRERTLLCVYGALIITKDKSIAKEAVKSLFESYVEQPEEYHHALIRDHLRCICELAAELSVLPVEVDPKTFMNPIESDWSLEIPLDSEIEEWKQLPKLAHSCLEDDFFTYTLGCLKPWFHAVPKETLAKWILKRVVSGFRYAGSGCEGYDAYMTSHYGYGRSTPRWAERIGKKYQWIALYHLASRLYDHIPMDKDSWEPDPIGAPLILLEERKIDPTLPSNLIDNYGEKSCWWSTEYPDFDQLKMLSDSEWISRTNDLPDLEKLLRLIDPNGQSTSTVVSYLSWDASEEERSLDGPPYRRVWMHIQSYLVSNEKFDGAYKWLQRKNLFGRWMPEGANWSERFAGEYPWAAPYTSMPEEWFGRGGLDESTDAYKPSWNQISAEWGYDVSLPSRSFLVPSRIFFSREKLWWNGHDGFQLPGGKTVFRDPSILEPGPSALTSPTEELQRLLKDQGLKLIWTLLGEKQIVSLNSEVHPRTFSQIAFLKDDSTIHVNKRRFFDN